MNNFDYNKYGDSELTYEQRQVLLQLAAGSETTLKEISQLIKNGTDSAEVLNLEAETAAKKIDAICSAIKTIDSQDSRIDTLKDEIRRLEGKVFDLEVANEDLLDKFITDCL